MSKVTLGIELAASNISMEMEADTSETLADVTRRAIASLFPQETQDWKDCHLKNSCGLDLELGRTVEEVGIDNGAVLKLTILF